MTSDQSTSEPSKTRRTRGLAIGGVGLVALFLAAIPIWASPASAEVAVTYDPHTGIAGTAVGFGIAGCAEFAEDFDIIIEINTDADDDSPGQKDFTAFELEDDNTYVYSAPPEIDVIQGEDVGPTYDVSVLCVGEEEDEPVLIPAGTFTYVRATTTSSSTSTSTSTTAPPATTTSTTTGATTTTAPVVTTTTLAGTTTSTTAPAATTTTSTTAPAATTTTSTTTPAATTTTPAGATTTTTVAAATTTSTVGAGTTSTTKPSTGTTGVTTSSTSSTTSSTIAPSASVSDTTPTIGQSITLTARGFAPGSSVAVDLLSAPVRLTALTPDAQGVATGQATIPLDTVPGAHEIRFTGTTTGGTTTVLSVAITVEKPLPRTGGESWTMFRVSLLLIGLGMLAMGRGQLLAAKA